MNNSTLYYKYWKIYLYTLASFWLHKNKKKKENGRNNTYNKMKGALESQYVLQNNTIHCSYMQQTEQSLVEVFQNRCS